MRKKDNQRVQLIESSAGGGGCVSRVPGAEIYAHKIIRSSKMNEDRRASNSTVAIFLSVTDW